MPRAKKDESKTSAELSAEIKAIQKKIALKRKAMQSAQKREHAEARRIKEYEESKFNREFVEAAKIIQVSDCIGDNRTVYEIIKSLICPSV